jgi:hypothetical protein
MCKTVMNSIVYSNFADACAFEDVIAITKNIKSRLPKHYTPLHLYIPARPPDFNY